MLIDTLSHELGTKLRYRMNLAHLQWNAHIGALFAPPAHGFGVDKVSKVLAASVAWVLRYRTRFQEIERVRSMTLAERRRCGYAA